MLRLIGAQGRTMAVLEAQLMAEKRCMSYANPSRPRVNVGRR